MADKNKLTVAELLARDKKARGEKGGKDEKRSRRHRRSLDEGGISVAELTGNLKKVEASPAEAKHTSVSIDEGAPVIRAPKAADATDADSAKKSADKPASQSAATTAAQPAAPKAAPKTAAKAEPKAAPKSADKPAAKAAAKPAQTAQPAASAPSAAQPTAKKKQPSADDTAVIQRVDKAKTDDAKSAATKPAAAKAGTAKPAAEKPTADKASADKITAAKPAAEKPKADKGAKAAGAGAAAAGAGAAAAAVPASKKAGVAKDAEETGNLPKVEDDKEWIEEEHEKLNPVSILLMIVAGILLAIVIFKGFEILWDSFPRLVVAILALCVTAIMVGVTHALRTARDGFSMFLAGFTGLILTFGPLLLVML
ncbi:tripartite tricarboxylate transporter TctB family protein [Corynebacterium tuberculostearicum]|uniref:tripartite tricarboxylate transporter TctB family protein n=1 Tax=Corynebacterium TaxID=1716 RepID=UPI001EF2523C|nr:MULTISPECIES: tripartite tricarboxylate transporter TctB family protein [Corynebacterium]MCG7465926.1 tripartite tricarboxylate transporter TctB family protein [Corynebacterium sp. ACRPJ]WKE53131.1 tripartite tricarboxylate transporter TctB family protein [Corynebacterium tuberculostearicum]